MSGMADLTSRPVQDSDQIPSCSGSILLGNKPFDHPVYSKISRINGEINRLNKSELQRKLSKLKLDSRYVKQLYEQIYTWLFVYIFISYLCSGETKTFCVDASRAFTRSRT